MPGSTHRAATRASSRGPRPRAAVKTAWSSTLTLGRPPGRRALLLCMPQAETQAHQRAAHPQRPRRPPAGRHCDRCGGRRVLPLQDFKETTPVTHRTEHVALSDAQQTRLGGPAVREDAQRKPGEDPLVGHDYIVHVQRVASTTPAVAARDKPRSNWKVTLLRKNEANAYCLPGGKIVVYTGILPVAGSVARLPRCWGTVAHATAEHSAGADRREHLTKIAAAIVAGGVASHRGSICASSPCSAWPARSRSPGHRSPRRTTSAWSHPPGRYRPRQALAFRNCRMEKVVERTSRPVLERSPERRALASSGSASGCRSARLCRRRVDRPPFRTALRRLWTVAADRPPSGRRRRRRPPPAATWRAARGRSGRRPSSRRR